MPGNLEPGSTLGSYRIEKLLGKGGMGEVYLAEDTRLNRQVALKVLAEKISQDSVSLRRFRREAKSAASLHHPNICTMHEIGEADGRTFIALEYCEGVTLQQRLAKGDPLSVDEVLDIGIQVADALQEARKKNIVHRDIKSSNILLTPQKQVKILDFGLAKQLISPDQDLTDASTVSKLTETGAILGTAAYMSPEQAMAGDVDHRSDIFSFGVVMYEMLTGKLPFSGESTAELLVAIIHKDPAGIARYNDNVPDPLIRIVNKMLQKEPGDRYQNVHEVWTDLRQLKRESASQTTLEVGRQKSAAAKLRYSAFGIVIAIGVIVASVIFLSTKEESPPRHATPTEVAKQETTAPGERETEPERLKSVAVLPFKNMTGDSNWDYFGVGLADAITSRLSPSRELVVRPISTVLAQNTSDPIQAAGALQVDQVVDGLYQKSGTLIRVSVKLLNADGSHNWTDEIEAEEGEAFTLQKEISLLLASALQAKVGGTEGLAATQMDTQSSEAYFNYMQGRERYLRFYGRDSSYENLQEAEKYLNKAIELDPDYAAPYSTLSQVLLFMLDMGYVTSPEIIDRVLKLAEHAIRLDSAQAEAYGSLGYAYSLRGQVSECFRALKKALTLEPNNELIHHQIAVFSLGLGLEEQFLHHCGIMERLNSTNLYPKRMRPMFRLFSGDYQEAIYGLKAYTEFDPHPVFVGFLAIAHAGNGDKAEALRLIASPEVPKYIKVTAYAVMGEKTECRKLLDSDTLTYASVDPLVANTMAVTYARLDDRDAAIEWIQKAIQLGWRSYPFYAKDPSFDSIRNDPRFVKILARQKTEWEENKKKYVF